MAIRKTIKRVVTKSGQIRYYANGKRVSEKSGRRRFIKQNPNVSYTNLTEGEKRSLRASQAAKKNWKFKNLARVQYAYVKILSDLGVIDEQGIPNNDLYYAFDAKGKRLFENFEDIVKYIDDRAKKNPLVFQWCNERGLPNYRGRTYENFANDRLTSIVDIVDLLDSKAYQKYKFVVIDENGEQHSGRVLGLLALRDFEIRTGTTIQSLVSNSAFMRFCYNYNVDFKNKTITISLKDQKPNKEIDNYVDEAEGTGAKQKLFIEDKYEDVEIEIDFS